MSAGIQKTKWPDLYEFGAKLGFTVTADGRRLVLEVVDGSILAESLSPRYISALENLGFCAQDFQPRQTGLRIIASGSALTLADLQILFPRFQASRHLREMSRGEVLIELPTPKPSDPALEALDAPEGFVELVLEMDKGHIETYSPRDSILNIDAIVKKSGLGMKWMILRPGNNESRDYDAPVYGVFQAIETGPVGRAEVFRDGKAIFFVDKDRYREGYYYATSDNETQRTAIEEMTRLLLNPAATPEAAAGETTTTQTLTKTPENEPLSVTPEQYRHILRSKKRQEDNQDMLDSLFGGRIVAVRNALRRLGWENDDSQTIGHGPLFKNGVEFKQDFIQIGPGANIIGMTLQGIHDDLAKTTDELAMEIDRIAMADKLTQKKWTGKIDDVGEKIGGARKDIAGRRLVLADLANMNDLEKKELVVKDKIFPPLDYRKMREDGIDPAVALLLKHLRDRVPTSAQKVKNRIGKDFYVSSGISEGQFGWDCELKKCTDEDYIKGVTFLYENLVDVETLDDLSKRCQGMRDFFYGSYGTGRINSKDFFETEQGKQFIESKQFQEIIGAKTYSAIRSIDNYIDWARRITKDNNWSKIIRERTTGREKPDGEKTDIIPERPHLAKVVREGEEIRRGKNIAADELLHAVSCRGIEFGNWLPQDERQSVINHAYDAFHDLASVVVLPYEEISLGGSLAMAFGARGRGGKRAALAHYEPARKVINLTRLSGAGSLAHEWAHALDNYLGESVGLNGGYLSEGARFKRTSEEAGEVYLAISGLMQAIKERPLTAGEMLSASKTEAIKFLDWAQSWAKAWAFNAFRNPEKGNEYLAEVTARVGQFKNSVQEGFSQGTVEELNSLMNSLPKVFHKHGGKKISSKKQRGFWSCANAAMSRADIFVQLAKKDKNEFCDPTATRPTEFYASAKKLDCNKSREYWAKDVELFARAFECWVFDRLSARGIRSDYLVHGVEEDLFAGGNYRGNPYPAGEERFKINQCMDKFIRAVASYIYLLREHEKMKAKSAMTPC